MRRRLHRAWTRRSGNRDGFSLIELVIAVTILGVIIGSLTSASIFFLQHGQDASLRFSDDTSIRAIDSLFTTDAQSAETVAVPDPTPCGSAGSALATMTWTDGGTIFKASWATTTSGPTTTLVRSRCTGTTLVSTLLVADVQSAPTVTCAPSCANPSTITITGTAASGAGFSDTAKRRST